MSLNKLFNPKSVAVIGASNEKGSVGYDLFSNLVKSKYKGKVYPVNIKRKKIQGRIAYKSIKEIPRKIDLAIIAVPAGIVPAIVRECGEAKVGSLVIISAGFSEIGKEGESLQKEIKQLGKKYNMRIIGPNCLGFIRPSINLNASFANIIPQKGKIAFISQSGALCASMLDWSADNSVGYSYFISIGSMVDVNFADLIGYLEKDKETSSIVLYMESLVDAKGFIDIASRVSKKKPIVVLKVGRSKEGSKAAKSHTGSLTGDDKVFSAAFEKAGVIRIDTVDDLFNVAKLASANRLPAGGNLAIVTNAGGPGVIASDALANLGGKLAKLSKNTIDSLNKVLPAAWSHNNPVDVLGDADAEKYKYAMEACLRDKAVDSLLVILTPQSMTKADKVADEILRIAKSSKKYVIASFIGSKYLSDSIKMLNHNGVPTFASPESAIKSYMYFQKSAENKRRAKSGKIFSGAKFKKAANKKIIEKVLLEKRKALTEEEAKIFLKNYSLPILKNAVANNQVEAGKLADKIGYPLAMKIMSSEIIHKVDVGGVKLNINSRQEAIVAYKEIISSVKRKAKVNIDTVILEPMSEGGFELIIGCKRDKLFGPVIIFGTGGTNVEIYEDISMVLPPVTSKEADDLVKDTKIYKLLKGYRGSESVDLEGLKKIICNFSQLIEDFPEIKELDINPLKIDKKGAVVIDAKIILQ